MRDSLCVDARWLSTGIGTYTFGFLSKLKRCGELSLRTITTDDNRDRIAPYCDDVSIVNAPIYSIREQFEIPLAARGARVLHVPHYNAAMLFPGTLLVSVLDLTHVLDVTFRTSWKSRIYTRPMLQGIKRRAAHIFTLSEYAKRTILEHLNVPNDMVSVVSCGVNEDLSVIPPEVARAVATSVLGADAPFVLYIGNLKPHKNVPTLLSAYQILKARCHLPYKLVVIGDDPRGRPELQSLAIDLGIAEDVTFLRKVRKEDIAAIYSAAEVVVQPSFEEGFGLPVIEAMACGTPVICSQSASLPEVGGDAAVYFDPNSSEQLSCVLQEVLDSPTLLSEMRERGFRQSSKFSWRDCAQRHFDVYQGFLGKA